MSESGQGERSRPGPPAEANRDATPAQATESTGGWDAEFTTFYREWTKRLVGFLVMQGADVALAADVVQESMTALYRRWPQVDHPRSWVFRVASRGLVRAISTVESPTDQQVLTPLLGNQSTDIHRWEQRHDLIEQIRRLPPRQRQVMAWTLYGHTPGEIADQLGLSAEAVRSTLYQARITLKAWRAREEDQ